jgi:hypothetical protein
MATSSCLPAWPCAILFCRRALVINDACYEISVTYVLKELPEVVLAPLGGVIKPSACGLVKLGLNHSEQLLVTGVASVHVALPTTLVSPSPHIPETCTHSAQELLHIILTPRSRLTRRCVRLLLDLLRLASLLLDLVLSLRSDLLDLVLGLRCKLLRLGADLLRLDLSFPGNLLCLLSGLLG